MNVPNWSEVLARIASKPAPVPGDERDLRIALLAADSIADPDLDNALSATWKATEPIVRRDVLRDACEGLALGVGFVETLITSIEEDAHVSANAAIAILQDAVDLDLTADHWQRIGRVARRQRDDLLPDIEAAQLLAAHAPAGSFATLALIAFRAGPEDAEDRGMSVAALGRFDDPRVADWLTVVARSGVLGLETLQAAAEWLARNRTSATSSERAAWMGIVHNAAGVGERSSIAVVDAWQRWGALEIAAAMDGYEALPFVIGAWQAGANDAEPWFMPGVTQRSTELCQDAALAAKGPAAIAESLVAAGTAIPSMAPIPPVRQRVDARCARIGRRAMVLFEEAGGDADVLKSVQAQRAAVEKALVERKQLMGSLLVGFDDDAAELGDEWAPVCDAMTDDQRADLRRDEDAWLGPVST